MGIGRRICRSYFASTAISVEAYLKAEADLFHLLEDEPVSELKYVGVDSTSGYAPSQRSLQSQSVHT
jgi:hypothetical protein